MHVLKIRKSGLKPYEEWPTFIPGPDEICHIEAVAPKKTVYAAGDALDLAGGQILVSCWDGTTFIVPMTDREVSVCEPDLTVNYTTRFGGPDMNRPGEHILRADYRHFAARFTIHVK